MSYSRLNCFYIVVAGVFFAFGNSVEVQAQSMAELFEAHNKAFGINRSAERDSRSMYSFFIMLGEDELDRTRGTKLMSPEEHLKVTALESALEKLLEYHKQTLEGVEGLDYSLVERDLTSDSTVADKIFHAIGEARMQELVQGSVVKSLQMQTARSAENSHTPNNFLLMESVADAIGLSDSQIDKIEKLSEETALELRDGPPRPIGNLDSAIEKHWKYVLSVLNSTQRREVKRLVGSPFKWHRSFAEPQLRKLNLDIAFREHFSAACDQLAKKLKKTRVADLTAEEMAENGIEFIHAHLVYIMESRIVWDEFEFTDKQRENVKKQFRDYWYKKGFVTSRKHKDRLSQLFADEAGEYPSIFKEILLDHQLKYLSQLEFQVLTNQFETSFGLLHPACKVSLDLSDDQAGKIEEASKAFQAKRQELEQTLGEERDKIRLDFAKKVSDILTPQQRDQFKSLMGFDVVESTKK
jgi:hypothetical protein